MSRPKSLAGLGLLLVLCCSCLLVEGHFRLTYPLAREIDLDFLDNVRTAVPCGVPYDDAKARTTTLAAGSTVRVAWHLGYAHRGGLKFFLLTNRNTYELSGGSWVETSDPTALSYEITLPAGVTCSASNASVCTLQVRRQALEWGRNYIFHSCADLNIVQSAEFTCPRINGQVCSGVGSCLGAVCQCPDGYSGDACQHADECISDQDCGGSSQGRCVHMDTAASRSRQCYCKSGFFGPRCRKVSSLSDAAIDPADYTNSVAFSPTYSMYWKHIGGADPQIEIALKVRTTSWVGLGWKPSNLDSRCQRIPRVLPPGNARRACRPRPAGYVAPEPEARPEAGPETSPEQPVDGHAHPEGEPELHPRTTPETSPESHPEGSPEHSAEPTPAHPNYCPPASPPKASVAGYSRGCVEGRPDHCTYKANWVVDYDMQIVNFTLTTNEVGYIALGVSKNRNMPDTDMTIAWINHQTAEVTVRDAWAKTYSTPEIDDDGDQSQVMFATGRRENGISTYTYSRPCRVENNDYDYSLAGSNIYFFYATGATYVGRFVGMHQVTPVISPDMIHINCTRPAVHRCQPRPEGETQPEPEGTAEPEGTGEPHAEGENHPEPEGTAEPEGTGEPHAEGEHHPEPESTANPHLHHSHPHGEPEGTAEPQGEGKPESTPEPHGEGEPQTSPESGPEHHPEPEAEDSVLPWCDEIMSYPRGTAEPEAEPEHHGTAEPESTPEHHGTAEPESTPEHHGTAEPEAEPEHHSTAEPESTPEHHGTAEPESTPEHHGTAEPEAEPEHHGTAEPESTPEHHGTAEPEGTPEHHGTAEPESTPEHPGTAEPEGTPERHQGTAEPEGTPEHHGTAEPEVEPETTAAAEAEPETTPAPETEPPTAPAVMCCGKMYRPENLYSYNEGCESPESDRCTYKVCCAPNAAANKVDCSMCTTQTGWIALGVSKDKFMPNTDLTIGWMVQGGGLTIKDGMTTGYAPPPPEADQSQLTGTQGSLVDGLTTISFARACRSTDPSDFNLDDKDNYLAFATGPVYAGLYIGKHTMYPRFSKGFVSFDCGNADRMRRQAPEPAPEGVGRAIHPMDCSDMVIGTAKGDAFRLYDAYTRDRSTPRADSVYGGVDNILAAVGRQTATGFTELKFRRRLNTMSEFDHPLNNGLQYFIYAHGQEQNNYHFQLRTGVNVVTASDRQFYKDDELKYHGFTRNRGSRLVDFAEATPTVPAELPGASFFCIDGACRYKVTWEVDTDKQLVRFTLSTTQGENNWIGIGFSKNRMMAETDVVVAWIGADGLPVVTDRYAKYYSQPALDADQSQVSDVSGGTVDGMTTIRFSRPCTSSNDQDFSLADSDNYHVYPMGQLSADKTTFYKHSTTPIISSGHINIDCSRPAVTPTQEPEPEHSAEPEPGHTAEPEPGHTAEPEPEHTAEPEPEHTAEPEPEQTAEPEPEQTAKAEEVRTAAPTLPSGRLVFCPAIEGCAHYAPPTPGQCCPVCRLMITKDSPTCPPGSCPPTARCRFYAREYASGQCCLECASARRPPRNNRVRTLCSTVQCPLGTTCAMVNEQATCQCKRKCAVPTATSQVCGTDGKTYGNTCMLRRKACIECLPTLYAHAGPCL